MSCIVFAGPSLTPGAVAALPGAEHWPPAAQGDVYRAAEAVPRVIALIDGVFEGVPAVWHKEILWALSQGIQVFGAASMGALRAAELHSFGMRGIGTIFEAYRDGVLEDDDEVALLHGPAETGYAALSEAMVNVRASLDRAAADGVVDRALRDDLEALAKQIFYQDRTWPAILDAARWEAGSEPLDRLAAWLPGGRVDQKRIDALALLDAVGEMLAEAPAPFCATFAFEHTDMWEMGVSSSFGAAVRTDGGGGAEHRARILDELRLDVSAYEQSMIAAARRRLALAEARRGGASASPDSVRKRLTAFRERHGLFARRQLDEWLAASGLDARMLERLLEDDVVIDAVASSAVLDHDLLAVLRLEGRYERLSHRAEDKARVLTNLGLSDAGPEDIGFTRPQLLAWFFESCLGRSIPDQLDEWLSTLGLKNPSDFYRLLTREFVYCRQEGREPDPKEEPVRR